MYTYRHKTEMFLTAAMFRLTFLKSILIKATPHVFKQSLPHPELNSNSVNELCECYNA